MLGQLGTYVDTCILVLKPILVNFQLECYSNYWIYEQPIFWYCQIYWVIFVGFQVHS